MSIVKINKVNNLKRAVKYILQDYKTNTHLVTTYECSAETIENDFKDILYSYNEKNNANKKLSARMIIQSFDPDENITPELAHQCGVELAQNFLDSEHQFIVVTHIETNHIHNHIIFNDVNFKSFKMFNSKRSNSIYRLRYENDKISEKYGLRIIEKSREKSKYLAFNEYVARTKGISFKQRIENDIDECIQKATNFDEFLSNMKKKGYEWKCGKYLSFKHPRAKKFIRTKTLGVNYLERSIKFRIENKDYVPIKPRIINREWIDKTQQKFKKNKALRKWATIQNIQFLNDINNILFKEKITLAELQEIEQKQKDLVNDFEQKIVKIDDEIHKLEKMKSAFDIYKNSHSMILEYKKLQSLEERTTYKSKHFKEFKQYDQAKYYLKELEKQYNIRDKETLQNKIEMLKIERDEIYKTLNMNIRDREREKEIDR